MDELLLKLLEQTPVIIVLGVGIYALWKEKREDKKEIQLERQSHQQQITDLTLKHVDEIKELNSYIKERDLETLKALEETTIAFQSIKQMLEDKLRLLD